MQLHVYGSYSKVGECDCDGSMWLLIVLCVCVRLVHLIGQNEVSSRLVREAVVALGSFAHGRAG